MVLVFTLGMLVGLSGCKSGPDGGLRVARSELAQIGGFIEVFQVMYGRLPESLDDLTRDFEHRAVASQIPLDPWENPYRYAPNRDGRTFRLSSMGPDGAAGTEDDIQQPTN